MHSALSKVMHNAQCISKGIHNDDSSPSLHSTSHLKQHRDLKRRLAQHVVATVRRES